MPDIRHRVGISAPQEQVREALATREGLAEWWTRDVRVTADGRLAFHFGGDTPGAVMEVVQDDQAAVAWRVVEGADEWLGTTITFDLRPGEDETVLLFTHADWREPVEFMHHCSTRWGTFLMSLKDGLEGRGARPFPDDVRASSSWR